MAQTIRIEIPVEVQDNTGAVEGIKKKLEDLGKTSESVSKSLNSIGKTGARKGLMSFADIDSSSVSKVLSEVESGGSKIGRLWSTTTGVVNKLMSPLTSVASMLTSPLTGLASMAGASMGLADAVSTYSDFGATMSRVEALANANEEQMVRLTQTAKDMGATTKFSATESAEAFTYMAQAGWSVDDMISGIGGVMSLAAADGLDLASTTDIVSNALTAFGLSAKDTAQFADVLAVASSASNTDVYNLGESLKYAAPVMGALGYNIQDTALALGLMSNNAITGSMAGTALRTSLTNMASPTEAMATAMEKYGISLTDSEGNMKSLRGVMENLRSSLGGLSESEQTAAASTIFGKEAMSGMLAIINASEEDWQSLAAQIDNSAGAADRMAETMQDNLAGALEEMGGAVETAQITLGERLEPYITGVAGFVTEAMPAVEDAINDIMDFVDVKVGNISQKINALTLTDEWQNADLFGKIDLAWDKLIVEPSASWLKETGVHIATGIVGGMFSEAAKILPGGEEAGIMSWLSAGTLIKGADKAVSGIRKFTSVLSDISPVAGKVGLATAGVAAGIAAIAVAVDNYNQNLLDQNLEEHFGSLSLTADQIQELAEYVVPVEITADLKLANVNFEEAEQLVEEAEAALEANNFINWKVHRVGVDLTEVDKENLLTNTETFVTNVEESLEKEEYAAELSVKAILGEVESQEIVSQMQAWFKEDAEIVSTLGDAVTDLLQNALDEGTYNIDTSTAISIMQSKMLDMTNGAKQAELKGKLSWLELTSNGAALDADSWSAFVTEAGTYQQELLNAESANYQNVFAKLNQAAYNDPSRTGQVEQMKLLLGDAYNELGTTSLLNVWGTFQDSLSTAYGDELNTAKENISSSTQDWIKFFNSEMESAANMKGTVDPYQYLNSAMLNAETISGDLDKGTQLALMDRYETLFPTVEQLQGAIDSVYGENGEQLRKVPQAVMDAYYQAMEIGAAGGDDYAINALMAKQVAESFGGDKSSFMSMLEDAGITFEGLPEAFQEGLNRAFAETTDMDFTGLSDKLMESFSGEEVDWQAVESILNEYGFSVSEALSEQGIDVEGDVKANADGVNLDLDEISHRLEQSMSALTAEGVEFSVTAEGVQVDLTNVEVDSETAMGQIEAALGMETGTLSGAGIEVESGATVTIPSELVQVDTSDFQSAVGEAAEAEQPESVPVDAGADVKVGVDNVDASEAYVNTASEAQETFADPVPVDADAELNMTHNNSTSEVSRIYGEVDGEIKGKFASGFTANADVYVSLNWKITNPTASISVSASGGSATATIGSAAASAEGRFVDSPLLSWIGEDGPEFVIPVGASRRSRGLELWQQAGRMLGVPGYADGGIFAPYSLSNTFGETDSGGNAPGFNVSVPESKEAGDSGKPFQVSVNMNNTFEISGDNPTNILQMIKANMKTITDDLSKEIADRLADSFSNRPV
ncbi:MAG TPA: phage tail tape measure protein [Candidatus Blautia faecavium]|uniref:Phage tail tape measure protein n=1 Tax=Candidatus Blautia faecavium TaxID=2838487 RepID=A0A9D2RXN7_9FIRM|nr:phage tail tape measure protein [Candidatus Blautia faecavium]